MLFCNVQKSLRCFLVGTASYVPTITIIRQNGDETLLDDFSEFYEVIRGLSQFPPSSCMVSVFW